MLNSEFQEHRSKYSCYDTIVSLDHNPVIPNMENRLGIEGFDKDIIFKLYVKGYLTNYPDLFRLTKEQLSEVMEDGDKVIDSIVKRKGLSTSLLSSLPIHGEGESIFKLVDISMKPSDMVEKVGIPDGTVTKIRNYVMTNLNMIDELLNITEARSTIKLSDKE